MINIIKLDTFIGILNVFFKFEMSLKNNLINY